MRITIASGKGGTGKTTIAVNLALSLADRHPVHFVDCDVEEPNGHIFLTPDIEVRRSVEKLLPRVDPDLCSSCGTCAKLCQFGAIAVLGDRTLVFDELCHGCGLCTMACPQSAIHEEPHELGAVESGTARGLVFTQGILNVGEAMATPIIHELKHEIRPEDCTILDAPPGTGCPAIAALEGASVALLVTEPTPFGLHDLRAAVGVARVLDVPTAVLINRDGIGNDEVDAYCRSESIPVLMRIPFDRDLASLYAEGRPMVDAMPEWRDRFRVLHEDLKEIAK